MGINVNTSSWGTNESLDFIAFAFGDFNTSTYNNSTKSFVRTSDGDRYNQHLSPQLNDKTADVPGGDGMYFFGTTHKARTFDVSFAFQGLTKTDIRTLKKAFDGKEIKELCFAEERDRIYMAKVTSQPSIKMLAFGDDTVETYNGEGTVQFTAYWPYARSKDKVEISNSYTATSEDATTAVETTLSNQLDNTGDLPAFFEFETTSQNVSEIIIKQGDTELCKISGENITYWSSKTGIVKSGTQLIPYTGDGLFNIPPAEATNKYSVIIKHKNTECSFTFKYYYWYY